MIADQDARDQLLGDHDATFFVEAGAGTGKTTIVVGRIVNLVVTGRVRMEELAAITFTDAAAAELRERIRERLEQEAAGRSDPAERDRCAVAAAEIDLAAIQTIHAFAGGLLRAFPIEARLPPGFGTLDEVEREFLFEDRFRAWFWGAALERPAREILRRALLLGLTQQHLRDLAAALDRQHDLITRDMTWEAPEPPAALAAAHEASQQLRALPNFIQYAVSGESDPLASEVRRVQPAAERLAAARTEEQALAALLLLADIKLPGSQKNWLAIPGGPNACKAIKDVLGRVRDSVIVATLEAHRRAAFAGVLGVLRDFVLDGVEQRRRDGVATFQDLLAWARDLLRDHPEARRRARRRYRRIFVDEFQDTDPLQAEIVLYLAAAPDAPLPADWRDIHPEPGKLFVVGDPKQSIYRFRRADIAVYDALLRRLEQAYVNLSQNFRSVRPVLEWVNHHFAAQMAEREGVQPRYHPLDIQHEPHAGGVRSGVYRIGDGLPGARAETLAWEEAQGLARAARAAVGGLLVAERSGDGTVLRPAQYRDCCILIRSRTHLRSLRRALEREGVPYRVEAGQVMLKTQEVRDLLACLRAIEDPSDQVALVAALRSPAYACSDPDLLRWVEGGGRLSHEGPGDGPAGPVAAALASLAEFHRRRGRLSPPALVETFVRDRLLVPAAFDHPNPRESWRRLRYVVARARAFTATGRHSLRAFLDWIDGLERAEARDAEGAATEPDEDAVRILTIHGAKGLEFPIVFLTGLGRSGGNSNNGPQVIPNRECPMPSLACRVDQDWRTADFEGAAEHEKQMDQAEAIRLLYVAATRARDHLVLCLHRKADDTKSVAALIARGLESFAGTCHELDVLDAPALEGAAEAPDSSRPDFAPDYHSAAAEQAWLAARGELIARLAAPPGLDVPSVSLVEEGVEPEGGLAASVRAILRRADGETSPFDPRARDVAAQIVADPAYRQAIAGPGCRRDVPLLATLDGVSIDITIDLLYETSDGVALVLYDLGSMSNARSDPGKLARAFAAVTGRPVHRVDLIRPVAACL